MKKNRIILIALILVTLLILIFFIYPRIRKSAGPAHSPIENTKPEFFESDTDNFSLTVGKMVFSHQRNEEGQWETPLIARQINERVSNLSLMHTQKIHKFGEAQLTLSFDARGHHWKGAWDGQNFKWLEGPKKDYGLTIKDGPFEMLFLEGQYTFEDKTKSWCPNRMEVLRLSDEEEQNNWVIYNSNLRWYKKHNEQPVSEFDGTYTEKWMGSACSLKIEYFVDLDLIDEENLSWYSLNVQFKDKGLQQIQFEPTKGWMSFLDDKGQRQTFQHKVFVDSLLPFYSPAVTQGQ